MAQPKKGKGLGSSMMGRDRRMELGAEGSVLYSPRLDRFVRGDVRR
jgi:hypothetical protein